MKPCGRGGSILSSKALQPSSHATITHQPPPITHLLLQAQQALQGERALALLAPRRRRRRRPAVPLCFLALLAAAAAAAACAAGAAGAPAAPRLARAGQCQADLLPQLPGSRQALLQGQGLG